MKNAITSVFICISVIILYILLQSFFAYLVTFYAPPRKRKRQQKSCTELCKQPYEKVYITSRDGLLLCGRYYHIADGAPLEIEFHGYRGSADGDFGGRGKLCREKGINALVVDQRAHGSSEGNTITFGINERYDCLDWVNYAVARFGSSLKIILRGASMGAATVLMASELPLPKNVVGIIADSPFSSPKEIIKKVCRKDIKIPANLSYPFLYLGAYIFGGFDLHSSSAENAVKKCNIPVLIIHGTDDRYVPFEMGKRIYTACASQNKTFLAIRNAGHVLGFATDPETYKDAVGSFADKALGR